MTVLLLRHGYSTANAEGHLAGRGPGVALTERGRAQADAVAAALAQAPIVAVVSSPLQRCLETVEPLAQALGVPVTTDDALAEVDYGEWTGRTVKDLAEEPLWKTVQQHASGARFPGGESLTQVQARAVAAIRERDAMLLDLALAEYRGDEQSRPRDVLWVACTHGDVVKSVLADALGMHLDLFQRIAVEPASVSVVHYGATRPTVPGINLPASALGDGRFAAPKQSIPGGEATADADRPAGEGSQP